MVAMTQVQINGTEVYKQYSAKGGLQLGTTGYDSYGRGFRWTLNGGVALTAGKLVASEAPGANFDELAIDGAHAIGDKTVTVTNGATAITANMFAGGFMTVEDDTGEGVMYPIRSHPAADTSATCEITLDVGIAIALGASATVGLTKHPCAAVVVAPTSQAGIVIGVPLLAVTAAYYFWAQFRGPCACLAVGTLVAGKAVFSSDTTAGGVEDAILAEGTPNTLFNQPLVGVCIEVAATTEYAPIMLNIP